MAPAPKALLPLEHANETNTRRWRSKRRRRNRRRMSRSSRRRRRRRRAKVATPTFLSMVHLFVL
jgi:hypothetical protein